MNAEASKPGDARGDARSVMLFWVGCVLAASFVIARLVEPPQPVGPIWKASGIAFLGAYALARGATLAGFGLFASALGDFILDLDPPIWISGMAAFGLAHMLYGLAFIQHLRATGRSSFGPFMAALSVILSVGAVFLFLSEMNALLVPGLLYHAVLTAMVALALLSRAPLAARVGAVLFLISDAVIALELYRGLGPFGPLNWLLYAPAQMLIAWGLSRPQVIARQPHRSNLR